MFTRERCISTITTAIILLAYSIVKATESNGNVTKEFNPYEAVAKEPHLNWTFKDYVRKFKPSKVWNDIEESNKLKGVNKTLKDEFATIFSRIDETDELLNLTVKNGDPKVVLNKDGRRWKPPGDITSSHYDPFSIRMRLLELMKQAIYQMAAGGNPPGDITSSHYDPFSIRMRLLELMKQAIYQARNKMVIMQEFREKYRNISLYKMGFLFSKVDIATKTFASFAYKAFKACSLSRQGAIRTYPLIDKLEVQERLLDLWFDVDLLVDLIVTNHENCKRMLNRVLTNRKHAWKFVD